MKLTKLVALWHIAVLHKLLCSKVCLKQIRVLNKNFLTILNYNQEMESNPNTFSFHVFVGSMFRGIIK